MGYYIEQRDSDFRIDGSKAIEAFTFAKKKLLEEMETKGRSGTHVDGELTNKSYAWISKKELEESKNVVDLLYLFGYNCFLSDDGSIDEISFESEKIGQEVLLFEALAPFVDENSYIEMSGEDGDIWRWVFKNKQCFEISADITFNME